tara:strand:- start:199 stop:474 length:276 start_codon:yes stop_codon:yes gene_type:complete
MRTAQRTEVVDDGREVGDAAVYKLSPPLDDGTDYVFVSAIPAAFDTGRPETMIFASDAVGTVLTWQDLVNFPGEDHVAALHILGYATMIVD